MMTIWKFPFIVMDELTIPMPRGATIIHVAAQKGVPCLWAVVNPGAPSEDRHFALRGTGHTLKFDFPDSHWTHVGSFEMLHGDLIWHLFESHPVEMVS